jgi:hypothetical protein
MEMPPFALAGCALQQLSTSLGFGEPRGIDVDQAGTLRAVEMCLLLGQLGSGPNAGSDRCTVMRRHQSQTTT